MTPREKLLKYLPKKYYDRFDDIELEADLIDDCKYLIFTSDKYIFEEGGNCLPCRSIKEATYYLKNSVVEIEKDRC